MIAVEVNEAKVWAVGTDEASEWWNLFRAKFAPTGRIRVLVTSLGGDRVLVGMDGLNHALEWIEVAQTQGVPRSAMTVRRNA